HPCSDPADEERRRARANDSREGRGARYRGSAGDAPFTCIPRLHARRRRSPGLPGLPVVSPLMRARRDWSAYLYIAPAFGLALLFSFFSMGVSLYASFHDWDPFAGAGRFVG